MTLSDEERRAAAEDLFHAYLLEASRLEPTASHLKAALHRWSEAMGNPRFVFDTRIDRTGDTPQVAQSDCTLLDSAFWDEFLTPDRGWTHCNMWTTTEGGLVVSLEAAAPLGRPLPSGAVLTGHVHVMPQPLAIRDD